MDAALARHVAPDGVTPPDAPFEPFLLHAPLFRRDEIEKRVAGDVEEAMRREQLFDLLARPAADKPFGLRRRKGWSCRHSDFNKMRNEQPGKIRDLDLALRRGRQPTSQLDSKVRRQRRRRNVLGFEQATEATKQVALILQGLGFIVPG
jgi:hypothetical protein